MLLLSVAVVCVLFTNGQMDHGMEFFSRSTNNFDENDPNILIHKKRGKRYPYFFDGTRGVFTANLVGFAIWREIPPKNFGGKREKGRDGTFDVVAVVVASNACCCCCVSYP